MAALRYQPALALAPACSTVAEAVASAQSHALWHSEMSPAPILELRLDRMVDASVTSLAWAAEQLGSHRLMATCRSVAQGGGQDGQALFGPNQQQALMEAAVQLRLALIDVELASLNQQTKLINSLVHAPQEALFARGAPTKWLASHHHRGMLDVFTLTAMAERAAHSGACALKVVLELGDNAQEHGSFIAWGHGPQPLPVLPIVLGASGLYSRVLVGRASRPPPLTLVRPDDGFDLGLGQPTLSEAAMLYRVPRITPNTLIFGLLGHPVGHSESPSLHGRAIIERGIDGIYLPFDWSGDVSEWLRHVAEPLGVRGLSVTAPHKNAAFEAASRHSIAADCAGAANTLILTSPSAWFADNTDGPAAVSCLSARLAVPLGRARVVLIGTGGAARGVACSLAQAGAQVQVWGRRDAAATALVAALNNCGKKGARDAAMLPLQAIGESGLEHALGRCDALVHCTPVGMQGSPGGIEALLPSVRALGLMPAHAVVFDTVYAPRQTALLTAAQALGLVAVGGYAMLQHQAMAQCRLFYGA